MPFRFVKTENGGIRAENIESDPTTSALSSQVVSLEENISCEFESSSDFLVTTDNKEFRLGLDGREGNNSIKKPKKVVKDPNKDWVYVANQATPGMLSSYDISCPEKPVYGDLDQVTASTSGPNDCATTGEYTFMVTNNGNLTVTDTSDPEDLNRVQTLFTNVGQLFHVDINDAEDLAAAVNTTGDGLLVFDISDPENASQVGQDGGFSAGGVAFIDNDTLAATNFGAAEVRTYDVSDPTSPTVIDTLSIGSQPVQVQLSFSGDFVYVAEFSSAGAYIVDVTDPSSLSQVKSLNPNTRPAARDPFQATSDYFYLFEKSGAVSVYDNSTESDPTLDYRYEFGGDIAGPLVDNGIAYIGDNSSHELIALKLNTHYNTSATLTSANILDVFKLRTDAAPANSDDPGEDGEIRIGEDGGSFYLYAYIGGGWKRTQLTTW